MIIKLWGVRGSIPTPIENREYREKLHLVVREAIRKGIHEEEDIEGFIRGLPDYLAYCYGGNTTCVSVIADDGTTCILDCGTGMRILGESMMSGPSGKGSCEMNVFLTHTHWDHIQGLPFFKPLYIPGNTIHFYSPYEGMEERLIAQMDFKFFPVGLHKTASGKEFHLIKPGEELRLGSDLLIDCHPLKHPGGSYAYRFRENGKNFIFCTDTEFTGETLEKPGSDMDFFHNADLMIIDSQYTLDESFLKMEWGHTCYTVAVNCGVRWGAKNLVLTHHEPAYTDETLHGIHANSLQHRNDMRTDSPRIFMAREGMTFKL